MTFKEFSIKTFLRLVIDKGPFKFYYCRGCHKAIADEDVLTHFQEYQQSYQVLVDICYRLNGIAIQSLSKKLVKCIH